MQWMIFLAEIIKAEYSEKIKVVTLLIKIRTEYFPGFRRKSYVSVSVDFRNSWLNLTKKLN